MLKEKDILHIIETKDLKIGFNNKIYLNEDYVLKVCYNKKREDKFLKEIEFYKEKEYSFMPRLIQSDTSKSIIPFYYIIISRIKGNNLFRIWSTLSNYERISVLKQLRKIMTIFHIKDETGIDYKNIYFKEFDKYLDNIISNKTMTENQIGFLLEKRNQLYNHYYMNSCYRIHGDLQFNNIIYLPDGTIKIIDFEHIEYAPLEKEYYQILRMLSNPNGFCNIDNSSSIDESSFKSFENMAYDILSEIKYNEFSEYNIFLFDYLNSLRWISKYPECKRYQKVLYEKVKKYGGIYERNN